MSVADAFRLLGLPDTATPDEVKAAWRKLAAVHHPDAGGDAETFNDYQLAYRDALEHAEAPKRCVTCGGNGHVWAGTGFHMIKVMCDACLGKGVK